MGQRSRICDIDASRGDSADHIAEREELDTLLEGQLVAMAFLVQRRGHMGGARRFESLRVINWRYGCAPIFQREATGRQGEPAICAT
jgi:hypothetical protein